MSTVGPHLGVFVEHDEHGRPVSISAIRPRPKDGHTVEVMPWVEGHDYVRRAWFPEKYRERPTAIECAWAAIKANA